MLRLKYNGLQALPLVLASLPRLAVLELSGNQIAEMDGTVLAQLSALRWGGGGEEPAQRSVCAWAKIDLHHRADRFLCMKNPFFNTEGVC